MALLEGKIDNRTYSARKLKDPKVREFMKRVAVSEDGALTAAYPGSISNRLTVRLEDGSAFSKQVDDPRGHPKNPMTEEEVEAKFSLLTKAVLTGRQVARVLESVERIERARDVSMLVESCTVKA